MKKIIYLVLLITSLITACSGGEGDTRRKKKNSTPEDTTIPPPLSRAERKMKNHGIFMEFWSDFQEGIFGKKKDILVNLTHFPFVGDFTCNEMIEKKEKNEEEKDEKRTEPPKRKPISKEIFLKCIEGELDRCLVKAIGEADLVKVEQTKLLEFEYLPEIKEEKGTQKPINKKNIKPIGRVTLQFKIINGQWKLAGMYLKGIKPDNCPN
ncbi:MAG: hypothetical protein EAZ06_06770 [Cytophagales bacterium]|nr:MAG: hypothetical protein EAZ06_06770 [Cytophagales bacterium]